MINDITINSLTQQTDGRFTIVFKSQGKQYKLSNLSEAFHAEHMRGGGNDSNDHYFMIGFEAIEFKDTNPLQEY